MNRGLILILPGPWPTTLGGSSNDFQYAYVPSFKCSAPYTYYTYLDANCDSTASWQLVYSDVLNRDYTIDFSNTSLQYSFQTPQLCEWRTGAVDASVSRGVYDGVRSSRVEEIIAALQSASKSYTFVSSSETGGFRTGIAIATKGSGTVPCFDCACRNGNMFGSIDAGLQRERVRAELRGYTSAVMCDKPDHLTSNQVSTESSDSESIYSHSRELPSAF